MKISHIVGFSRRTSRIFLYINTFWWESYPPRPKESKILLSIKPHCFHVDDDDSEDVAAVVFVVVVDDDGDDVFFFI